MYREKSAQNAYIIIHLHHHFKHVHYVDVSMPPEAMQMIEEQAEWATPSVLATQVRKLHSRVSMDQVYKAWRALSETHWRRDDLQIPSAKKLLDEYADEVDIFELNNVPDGVEILAWGMKKIVKPLEGKVVEVGMDATCTLKSHLY